MQELWEATLARRALLQRMAMLGVGAGVFGDAAVAAAKAKPKPKPKPAAAIDTKKTKVILAQPGAVASFEVDAATFVNAFQVNAICYDSLTQVDLPLDLTETQKLVAKQPIVAQPALAASWDASADRLTWRFHLRPNVKSPLGNTLTADDVVWSAQKWVGQKFVSAGLMLRVGITDAKAVRAIDRQTVEFKLGSTPPPWWLLMFPTGFLPVYDSVEMKKSVTADDPFAKARTRVGTAGYGPYYVSSVSPNGDQTVMSVHKNYWGPKPVLQTLVRQAIDDDGQRLQLLLSRNANYTDQLTYVEYQQVAKTKSWKVVGPYTSTRGLFIAISNTTPPFNDPAIRRGLAMAIPYDDIIDFVFRGRATRWKSQIRSWFPGYTEEFWHYDENPTEAAKALAPLKGQSITLQYPAGAGSAEPAAVLIQSAMKKIGIDFRLDGMPVSVYNQKRIAGDLAFFTDELDAPVIPSGHFELSQLFTSTSSQRTLLDFTGQNLIDPIWEKMTPLDPVKDAKQFIALLKQAQSILVPLMPRIPIAMTGTLAAMDKNLVGFKGHESSFLRFSEAYYQKA